MSKNQLSLPAAILININVMLGAGLFINTVELSKQAGILGGLTYVIVGLLMLPLIMSIAELLTIHPSGGFYTYGAVEINPFVGFISAWSYFTGKLASATLMIHTFTLITQSIIPILSAINALWLDSIILGIFIVLNMLNIQTGSKIQAWFLALKIIPITFVILTGFFLLNGSNFSPSHQLWSGIPLAIPIVLYAIIGFEAACSLSGKIKNAHKNGPRAIFISYGFVILLSFLYQTIFYGILGSQLVQCIDFRHAFPTLASIFIPYNFCAMFIALLHIAIAASALGGAYGIIFSNNWNLYTLAQHKHIFFSSAFIKLNRYHIPILCILAEGLICLLHLLISQGNQIPLQQISVLGCIIAYTTSVLALICAKKNNGRIAISWWIPLLGLINCLIFISACAYSLTYGNTYSLITFILLLFFGAIMFCSTRTNN